MEIALGAGGVVEGAVLDGVSHRPLHRAEVHAEGTWLERGGVLPVRQRAATGADGRFQLARLRPGHASLHVRAAGHHARLVRGLEVREGQSAGAISVELWPVEGDDKPQLELADLAVPSPQPRP